ncbi:MAG TPA: ClpX C4-type zinc finger protein [Ilumatobacteraceae bacterium]|nr:ClpX C4-type zinc finger protein [Ilumatobacteraceae bacterium]
MYCSFCRRDHHHVDKLVAGPGVFICDRCVTLADMAMAGRSIPDFPGWASLDDEQLLGSLVAADDGVRRLHDGIGELIHEIRTRGVSWARIGEALGVSRQAAWERFASFG